MHEMGWIGPLLLGGISPVLAVSWPFSILISPELRVDTLSMQWLTFSVMILIQVVGASALISKVKYISEENSKEIHRLRDWRDDFGGKAGVYDGYHERIEELGARVDKVDSQIDKLDTRVDRLEGRVGHLEQHKGSR